ncbi:hypothetical protein IFM89_012784 [Coptis chinensis]|uniref:Probable purine permease n=1 Tax=Coptis chinensis TaxID=261450 RepID=A0A835LE58_9MAGN|nr:hypothetical protein IFM89_012784 [Coptis chinensis]
MAETVMEGGTLTNGVQDSQKTQIPTRKRIRWWLLLLSGACTAVGTVGGPLLQKLYYMHGGNRKWLLSWLQSVGFPILIPPLFFLYLKNLSQKTATTSSLFFMEPKLFLSSFVLGIVLGFNTYMYSAGLAYIPVSTSSLLLSTQLAFTALFSFFIVKQKFTFYSFNSVVVMIFGTIVLALDTSHDRPPGISQGMYLSGFFLTLGGAASFGLTLPMMEYSYQLSTRPIDYTVVLQFQFVMNLSATIVTSVAMVIDKGFQVIPREARNYELGEVKYYVVLVASAIVWQVLSQGVIGTIYCSSSLFAGIITSFLLPLSEVAAIIAFHDKFTGEKGMSLALCLWGFASFFIGEYKNARKSEIIIETNETTV